MKLPISIFIITRNEEVRISRTIEAVRDWVAEVIVVDSGSTDETVTIAKALGAKTFHRDWTGYGPQKRFAEDQCLQDWWFNIDADEVVTPQLREELQSLFQIGEPSPCAFKVRIPYVYPGNEKPRPIASDYNVERLFHRTVGRYRDHPVYDRVVLEKGTTVRQLSSPLAHFAVLNWSQMMAKANTNSSHNIEKLAKKSELQLKLRMFFGFPLNFLRNYLFRGHFLGGSKGFIFALNTAYTRTMRVAKALELKQKRQTSS